MKTLKILFLSIIILTSYSIQAQVAITTDGSSASSSAMLEVKSTDKGFLPPRMSETQRDNISSPATGLIIYQTDGTAGLYQYDGSAWTAIGGNSPTTYAVGDFAQGGVVFYVDETGQHGLACAIVDQDGGSGIQWYNGSNTDTEANGDGVYAGEMNTMLIIANQGSNASDYAAGVCANYSVTQNSIIYGDWYLPSKEELNLMYQKKAIINTTAGANGGSSFATTNYWSSTEFSSSQAYKLYFPSGVIGSPFNKNLAHRVRAVRAF